MPSADCIYARIRSWLERRRLCDLYHSGLEVRVPEGRYVIEQTPVGPDSEERGVVGVGPIGARWLADRVPLFRYELRRWRDGAIPDVAEAVASPMKLTGDVPVARRLLDLVSEVPMLTWGADELGAGEMWNSNSQIAWLLARSGLDADHIKLPPNGRAPGQCFPCERLTWKQTDDIRDGVAMYGVVNNLRVSAAPGLDVPPTSAAWGQHDGAGRRGWSARPGRQRW